MSYTPTINTLDLLKGATAKVEVADWAAAGAATPFFDLGAMRDISIEGERTLKTVEADNYVGQLDAYYTGSKFTIKGTMLQADLRKLAIAMGDLDTEIYASAGVAATATSPNAIYYIDEPAGVNYWTVKLTVANQSMTPRSVAYIRRTFRFHRCIAAAKASMAYKKGDETIVPVEFTAVLDTSITTSGKIGTVTDAST